MVVHETANLNTNSNIVIKPNLNSLRNKNISHIFNYINNIISLTDIYGFDKSTHSILDTHLIKNNEWAAIAYFSQSKYGLCRNDICNTLANNDANYITGGLDYS